MNKSTMASRSPSSQPESEQPGWLAGWLAGSMSLCPSVSFFLALRLFLSLGFTS